MKPRFWLLPAALGAILYPAVTSGALTLDTGIGRRTQRLGPLTEHIDATPEVVFDVIAGPYLHKTPRAMDAKLHVLDRGQDFALAEHFTAIGGRLRATTLEVVRFEHPHNVSFRLVRGPVPEVTESFDLVAAGEQTDFTYSGVLGTDFWGPGEVWGCIVARKWVDTVRASMTTIKLEAERRARVNRSVVSGAEDS